MRKPIKGIQMMMAPVLFLLAILNHSIPGPESYPGSGIIEICDNGLDDDQDGLADLNDPDCACAWVAPVSLIPNPSFEEQNCCPAFRAQMYCAADWIQASAATTDYLHTCGWLGWRGLPPPLPFPDGEACIGLRNGRPPEDNGEGAQPNWKEYAGACLTAPLAAGVHYRFEFYVGFTHLDNSPSIQLEFFGTTDCANLPFGDGDSDFGCPSNGPNWISLGSVRLEGENEWKLAQIDVIPTEDIYAIAIGPDCSQQVSIFSLYYFFDKLVLAEEREFNFQLSTLGHPCAEDFGLSLPYYDTLQYQWYRDGVALPGEDGHQLQPVREDGDYQVRVTGPNSCRATPAYRHRKPVEIKAINASICQGETYSFGEQELTESGVYEQLLTAASNCDSILRLRLEVAGRVTDTISARIFEGESWPLGEIAYSKPGHYSATLLSSDGCDSLVYLILDTYKIFIPTAFSPNGDGANDRFTLFTGPGIEAVRLQAFGRWGGLVYDSGTLPAGVPGGGWNGMVQGRPAPRGTYVYQATLFTTDGREHRVSGELVLVR